MPNVYATHNVCELPRHDQTIAHTFATAGDGVEVIMWQEEGNQVYADALDKALPHHRTFRAGLANKNASPISFDTRVWRFIKGDAFRFQHGKDYVSKNRFWTWVILERIKDGQRVMFHSGHFWPRAWNHEGGPGPRHPKPANDAERQENTEQSFRQAEWLWGAKQVQTHLSALMNTYGLPMVIGTDANRQNHSFLEKGGVVAGRKAHQINRGLDWLVFVDGKSLVWNVPGRKVGTRRTESDHPVVYATATLAKPIRKPKPKPVDPFEHVVFRGKVMDRKTMAFVQGMEKRLGYELTVLQGCYNRGGVAASAGTHDGGGVLDLAPWDWRRKVRVARELGAFAWHRTAIPGTWGEHIHLGIRNHGRLAPAAQDQQRDYDATPPRNGLANHAPDDFGFRPSPPVTFKFNA